MKKFTPYDILAVLLTIPLLFSCTLEHVDNGKLDGYWHLEQVDTLATGGTCMLDEQRRFMGIQAHLLALSNIDNPDSPKNFICHFERQGNSLRIYDIYYDNRDNGDIKVTDASVLHPFGIHSLDETFNIDKLTHNALILRSEALALRFRRF